MTIFIGTDTVEGVAGTAIGIEGVAGTGIGGIAFGVLFSSSTTIGVLEGVVNGILLSGIVFCNFSLCIFSSSLAFAIFAFDDTLEEMGEKGCRVRGGSMSRELPAPNEYFFTGTPAISSPLLAA